MHTTSASASARAGSAHAHRQRPVQRATLDVAGIGYLVPAAGFHGRVHSVFRHACNLAVGQALLTIGACALGDGPTVLRLAVGARGDLRERFAVGEPVFGDGLHLRGPRTDLNLAAAMRWSPAPGGPLLPVARIRTRLQHAHARLAEQRRSHSSVLDRQGAPVLAALGDAVHALDVEQATHAIARLVGWGEGLTPAGDDVLVGLLAGLDALRHGDSRRLMFHCTLGAAVAACALRTTPIAAHGLRLAGAGHFNAPLLAVRDALLAEPRDEAVDDALQRALNIGASSGADALCGLLLALHAWLPGRPTVTSP